MAKSTRIDTSYVDLASIKDPTLQQSLRKVMDRLAAVEDQTSTIGTITEPLQDALDASSQHIKNLKDPIDAQDAVTRKWALDTIHAVVRTYAASLRPALPAPTPSTTTPPSPTPLPTPPPSAYDPPRSGSGSVRISGYTFVLADSGAIWPWMGCSDFLLFKRYLDGEDITPLIANRLSIGANLLRVFGMAINIANFNPASYPNYYSSLTTFADILDQNGLYLEFVALADAASIMPAHSDQIAHVASVNGALASSPNAFIELGNEWPNNGFDPLTFSAPPNVLSARASAGSGAVPPAPPWDYVTYHSPRDSEWPRKAKDIKEIRDGDGYPTPYGRPVVADEPMGAGDANTSSRSTVADDFFMYAALAHMMGAGATFHSQNGVESTPFSTIQAGCGDAFFRGWRYVPPEAQLWSYTRGPFADCPIYHSDELALRTYAKYTTNRAVAIAVRPQPNWNAIPQGDWNVDTQVGPGPGGGCLVFLFR